MDAGRVASGSGVGPVLPVHLLRDSRRQVAVVTLLRQATTLAEQGWAVEPGTGC